MDLEAKRPGEGGQLDADTCGQGVEGPEIGKILRTSFMDGPIFKLWNIKEIPKVRRRIACHRYLARGLYYKT